MRFTTWSSSALPRLQAARARGNNRAREVRDMALLLVLVVEGPQRGGALELHVVNRISVGGDDAVQLGGGQRGTRIDQLDGTRDALFVTALDQLEGAARGRETIVGGRDPFVSDDSRVVGDAHFECDPVLEILAECLRAIDLVTGLGAAGPGAGPPEQGPTDGEGERPQKATPRG